MSVSGLCQICENAEARHDCDNCGQVVCGAHYDESVALCQTCAREANPGQRPQGPDRDDPEGGDTHQL